MVFVQRGEVYVLGERCCDRSRQRLDRRAFPSGVGQINDISWVDETGRYPDHSATIRLRERSRLLSLREMRSRPAMIRKIGVIPRAGITPIAFYGFEMVAVVPSNFVSEMLNASL
jgi:hypothetical protein